MRGVYVPRLPGARVSSIITKPMSSPTDPSRSSSPPALSERVIVVVDDDDTVRAMTSTYLRRSGATVHHAGNGRDALVLLQTLTASGTFVHAVLCDLRMHGGSGMELHRHLCEQLPSLAARIVFFSGDVESDDVRAFVEQSTVTVLAKPYALAELRRRLAELPPSA